jgi:riboflavin kinase/FMN adenylyltransferase
MELLNDFKQWRPSGRPVAVTIGNFDGVHRGHQALLQRLHLLALRWQGAVLVVTFGNHPAGVLRPKAQMLRLCTPSHKYRLLAANAVDATMALAFTPALAQLTAEQFLSTLSQYIPFKALLLGHDAVLGKGRQGTPPVLQTIAQKLNFDLEYLKPVYVGDELVSSSLIRRYVAAGDLEGASRLLGRPYSLCGRIDRESAAGPLLLEGELLFHVEGLQMPPAGSYGAVLLFQGMSITATLQIPVVEVASLGSLCRLQLLEAVLFPIASLAVVGEVEVIVGGKAM